MSGQLAELVQIITDGSIDDAWDDAVKIINRDVGHELAFNSYQTNDLRAWVGYYMAEDGDSVLVFFSDDGVDVYLNGVLAHNGLGRPQHLQNMGQSFRVVPIHLEEGVLYNIMVVYRNIRFTGSADFDGGKGYGVKKFVDVDIDGMNEMTEDTIGGVVVKNFDGNNPPRKKIILNTRIVTGHVTLERTGLNFGQPNISLPAVRVFTSQTGGQEITFNGTDNKFAVNDGQWPKEFWVEGKDESNRMRDMRIRLKREVQGMATHSDDVRFTVLWVDMETDHEDQINADNAAILAYKDVVIPPSETLGYHLFLGRDDDHNECWNGRGSEFIGKVYPSDFRPDVFGIALRLKREVSNGNTFAGPTGKEFSKEVEPGPDTSFDHFRDDEPQSGNSSGKIYDVDAPGLDAFWKLDSGGL